MDVRRHNGFALGRDPQKAAFARMRFANVVVEEPDITRSGLRRAGIASMTDVLHHPSSLSGQHAILDTIAFPHDRFFFRRHEELAELLDSAGCTAEFGPFWQWTPYGSYVHVCAKK
jgi:hypothetical protein